MAFKKCKYDGCDVQVEMRNTDFGWRPFEESGNKHNCQYSDYAKKQRALQEQEKNDHGNEDTGPRPLEEKESPKFVDHTLPPKLKLTILTDSTAAGLAKLYNEFPHPIKFSQYQLAPPLYTMAVYYEELKP